MANRERGEVAVQVGDRTVTFCFDLNAATQVEDYFSTPDKEVSFVQILEKAEAGHARYVRAVFWAALLKFHPETTLEDAGNVIQDLGGLFGTRLQETLRAAVGGAKPDPADLKEAGEGKQKRPRRAQADRVNGTGETSISRPGASV